MLCMFSGCVREDSNGTSAGDATARSCPQDGHSAAARKKLGRWNRSLDMQVKLVASRAGGTLALGQLGWCIVSVRNISKEAIAFRTVAFAGKGGAAETPPAPDGGVYYHGVGVAALTARWSTDRTTGQWQTMAPPDNPIMLAPGEIMEFARLIQAPKAPGVYNLCVRFDTADTARVLRTLNNAVRDEPVCLEAVTKASITTGRREDSNGTGAGDSTATSRPQNGHAAVAQKKLGELNIWERKYGNLRRQDPQYDVPGAAMAHMLELKAEIRALRYYARWDSTKKEYRLAELPAESARTRPSTPGSTGRWNRSLDMRIKLIASRIDGALVPGEHGWCVVSLHNTSKQVITFRTVVFSGKGDAEQTPSAIGFSGFHGIGVAALTARWFIDRAPDFLGLGGEWQTLAPPDNPVTLAPGEIVEFARLIQAPTEPGVYTLRVRLDTRDAARASRTANDTTPDEPFCLEAVSTKVAVHCGLIQSSRSRDQPEDDRKSNPR